MRFDLKIPIGSLFSLYGALLALYGALGDPAQYNRSLGINVNAAWGLVLLLFGIALLVLKRSTK
jgi:multisubunit Na+/H+ antiporter MnhG subunit